MSKHPHDISAAIELLQDFINEACSCRSGLAPATKHDLQELEHKIMSKITDFAAATQANFDALSASLDGITTGIAALDTLITNFQNSPGTLSAADQASLDGIQAASQSLAAKAAAVSTTPPAPATP